MVCVRNSRLLYSCYHIDYGFIKNEALCDPKPNDLVDL